MTVYNVYSFRGVLQETFDTKAERRAQSGPSDRNLHGNK